MHDPQKNFIIELVEYGIVALIKAVEQLVAVVQAKSLDVPLENLRGWLFAAMLIFAAVELRDSFLFRCYCWLMNREEVRITVGAETLTVRRHWLGFGKIIERSAIRDVRVINNHPTGHDVVIVHDGGVLRLTSIFGDETRALLFKMRLDDLLANKFPAQAPDLGSRNPVTASEQRPLIH